MPQNIFTDPRDGQTYKTVQLKDGNIWMTQNLNFELEKDSWHYKDDPKNGDKYGRLYTWESAKKACPPGWRLPTQKEWRTMVKFYGGCDEDSNDKGTAAYYELIEGGDANFHALLGGSKSRLACNDLNFKGYYWSDTEFDEDNAWYFQFFNSRNRKLKHLVLRKELVKNMGFSVRCVKDETTENISKIDLSNEMKISDERDISGLQSTALSKLPRGEDYLFVIGIDAYPNFTPLYNAVKDAEDISRLLVDHYGFKAISAYQTILRNEQATRRNIIKQLKQLCQKVQENDRVLIYYSGHGHLDKLTKRGYWIPVDGEKEDDSTFVANSDIRDYIKAMQSRHVLLISDSCFSESLVVRNAERRVQGAYEKWERSKSRWLFSSGKGMVSDGKKGENSPFAKEIIRQLSQLDVDKINIVRLADEVTKNVSFNYEQKAEASPFFATGHDGGQFIFYKIQDERIEEAVEFENVKNNKNRYEMMHFLEKSKNKEHKKVIRQMLKTIEYGDVWQKVDKNVYSSLNDFIDDFPNHSKIGIAKELRDKVKSNVGMAEIQVEIKKLKMELEGMRKEDSTSKIITPILHITRNYNLLTDPRDGQEYKTVKLKDGKTWMAQNLNFDVGEGCSFYDNNSKNGEKYGRLYTWETALKACPEGWHVPSDDEWWEMVRHYGKAHNEYNGQEINENDGAGQVTEELGDSIFFTWLGSYKDSDGSSYDDIGESGCYVSSTKNGKSRAFFYDFFTNPNRIFRSGYSIDWSASCRCIQD